MLSTFLCRQPDEKVSKRCDQTERVSTYLALVLVGVDKLRSVAGNLGLCGACVLFGSIQCDLDVLNVRGEHCVEVPR